MTIQSSLPVILVIEIPSFTTDVWQLEHETGLQINEDNTLSEITNCIQSEDKANLELEYYCINLVGEHCSGTVYEEFNSIMHFLVDFGNLLIKQLKDLGAYTNGVFPYMFIKVRNNSIWFIRKDVFYNEIQKELKGGGYSAFTKFSTS